jgi:Holliday junction DNA helicase RuvA
MIDFLRGSVVHREADYVVLDVRGVGYRVFCANPYAVRAKDGEEVTLYIHHHVREDAILLYGFTTREEQTLFRRLLEVNGIGPRVAIGILAGGSPEAVVSAIRSEDVTFLTRLPGIGKKTAQRMILDLKDKLASLPAAGPSAAVSAAAAASSPTRIDDAVWAETKQALVALGYSEAEAERALAAVKPAAPDGATAQTLLKLALRALYNG